MKPAMRATSLLLALLLAGSGLVAQAQDVGQHPAVFAPRQLPGVDPSTFIVGHPASPTWRAGRAHHEHPAILVKREWAMRPVNPNTFLVQPPAHSRWIAQGAEGTLLAIPGLEAPQSQGIKVDRLPPVPFSWPGALRSAVANTRLQTWPFTLSIPQ